MSVAQLLVLLTFWFAGGTLAIVWATTLVHSTWRALDERAAKRAES